MWRGIELWYHISGKILYGRSIRINDNVLKLNDDNTQVLIITTHDDLSKISDISINF